MASELLYAVVTPKERQHLASQASDTGDPTVYAEVNVRRRSGRAGSTPKTTHTATCLKDSRWCYVVFALCFTAVILLIVAVLSAVRCHAF